MTAVTGCCLPVRRLARANPGEADRARARDSQQIRVSAYSIIKGNERFACGVY
jgi:hypothetical protein